MTYCNAYSIIYIAIKLLVGDKLNKRGFKQIEKEYGTVKAKQAMSWLYDSTTSDFRKCVYIVGFLESNEIHWI